jgi:hypothetical protein
MMSKQTIYLNFRGPYGVETVDSFTMGEDSPANPNEFRAYVNEMVGEYRLAGQPVYKSTRCTRDWAQK